MKWFRLCRVFFLWLSLLTCLMTSLCKTINSTQNVATNTRACYLWSNVTINRGNRCQTISDVMILNKNFLNIYIFSKQKWIWKQTPLVNFKYFCEREFAAFFVSFLTKKDQYLCFQEQKKLQYGDTALVNCEINVFFKIIFLVLKMKTWFKGKNIWRCNQTGSKNEMGKPKHVISRLRDLAAMHLSQRELEDWLSVRENPAALLSSLLR